MNTFEELFSDLRQKNNNLVNDAITRYLKSDVVKSTMTVDMFVLQNNSNIESLISKNVEHTIKKINHFAIQVTQNNIDEINREKKISVSYWNTRISDIKDWMLTGRV